MNKQEKRHFNMDSLMDGGGKKPSYFRLFEVFEALDEFSPLELEEAVAEEPFFPHLSSKCDYLKEKILQSLLFHRNRKDNSAESELRRLLDEVEILFDRHLLFSCRSKLRKAHEMAKKFDLPEYVLKILVWERRLLRVTRIPGNRKTLTQINEDENRALEKLMLQTRIIQEMDSVAFPSRDQISLQSPQQRLFGKGPVPGNLNPQSRWGLNTAEAEYAMRVGRPEIVLARQRDNYNLWKENPHLIKRDPQGFIAACNNYLQGLHEAEDFKLFEEVMEEASQSKDLPRYIRPLMEIVLGNLELIYYLNTLDLPNMEAQSIEFSKKIQKRETLIGPNKLQAYYLNLGLANYLLNKKKAARDRFQDILNYSKAERVTGYHHVAFLWRQVISYEMESDPQLWTHFHEQARNHFKRFRSPSTFAPMMLRCLNKNFKVVSVRTRMQNFKKFRADFDPSSPNGSKPGVGSANNFVHPRYAVLMDWIDSKISNSSLLEYLQSKT